MTLTDREYQVMRDAAVSVIREIGRRRRRLQHSVRNQSKDGEMRVIEMNPRVSYVVGARVQGHRFPDRAHRSQARVGYRLDEIPNDIHRDDARPRSSRYSNTWW